MKVNKMSRKQLFDKGIELGTDKIIYHKDSCKDGEPGNQLNSKHYQHILKRYKNT